MHKRESDPKCCNAQPSHVNGEQQHEPGCEHRPARMSVGPGPYQMDPSAAAALVQWNEAGRPALDLEAARAWHVVERIANDHAKPAPTSEVLTLREQVSKWKSEADMDRKEVAYKQAALRKAWDDRDTWRRRAEAAEARCATLSAAGQVLSEHVDKVLDVAPGATFTESGARRYPCSPTCTHDDADKPGHPERVNGDDNEEMESCNECEDRKPLSQMRSVEDGGWVCSAHVTNAHSCKNCDGIQPETCLFNHERVKERSEAVSAATQATLDVEYDSEHPEWPTRGDDDNTAAESDAFDRGAEAMRAACWKAVQAKIQEYGWDQSTELGRSIKVAIEGAVP